MGDDEFPYWGRMPVEIQQRVLRHATFKAIVLLGGTDRHNRALAKAQVRSRVKRLLSSYRLPIREFLDFMRRSKLGNLRLQPSVGLTGRYAYSRYRLVMDRPTSYPDYAYQSNPESGIKNVWTYLEQDTGQTINFIETTLPSVTPTVFMFHFTAVMNFISYNSLVSAYPELTFDKKCLHNTYRYADNSLTAACKAKYRARGFEILENGEEWDPDHDCGAEPNCAQTIRFIGDNATLRFNFTDDLFAPPDVLDPEVGWKLASFRTCKEDDPHRPYSGFSRGGEGGYLAKSLLNWLSGTIS
ncbi:hypothetical protein MD484_g8719, partial [Candolleomyces efflorescens]